jgi:hypothetical protein
MIHDWIRILYLLFLWYNLMEEFVGEYYKSALSYGRKGTHFIPKVFMNINNGIWKNLECYKTGTMICKNYMNSADNHFASQESNCIMYSSVDTICCKFHFSIYCVTELYYITGGSARWKKWSQKWYDFKSLPWKHGFIFMVLLTSCNPKLTRVRTQNVLQYCS